ncbi:hypothetical protein C8R43DRAFT_940776 [Mycena crocata]|nr:hypothetical protein C8R43DRAFT_940776 [Mycena crocata]
MPRWSAFCPRITVFLPHDCLFGGSIAHADGRPSLRPPVNNADGWGEKTTYRIAMLTDFREKVVYINGQNQPKWIGHSSSYATLLLQNGDMRCLPVPVEPFKQHKGVAVKCEEREGMCDQEQEVASRDLKTYDGGPALFRVQSWIELTMKEGIQHVLKNEGTTKFRAETGTHAAGPSAFGSDMGDRDPHPSAPRMRHHHLSAPKS